MKPILAVVLCSTMVLTGCTANWVQVALSDLPVLIQVATAILQLVGGPISAQEMTTINNISKQATADLQLIETLYTEYKANPNQTTLQKIVDAIQTADNNLGALLAAAHISDPALLAKITATVNLITSTLQSILALIPQPSTASAQSPKNVTPVPTPKELKARFNLICGNAACAVK